MSSSNYLDLTKKNQVIQIMVLENYLKTLLIKKKNPLLRKTVILMIL